jgi:hypothetical protein
MVRSTHSPSHGVCGRVKGELHELLGFSKFILKSDTDNAGNCSRNSTLAAGGILP